MNKQKQDIALFVSFCLEEYKMANSITGEQALDVFIEHGLIDHLSRHYEILHTQSRQWLLEEINELIEVRRKENVRI